MDPHGCQRGGLSFGGLLIIALLFSGIWYLSTHRSPEPQVTAPTRPPTTPAASTSPRVAPTTAHPPAQEIPPVADLAASSYSSAYTASLKTIATLIQDGRDVDAEAQLRALPPDVLTNLRVRHYVAVLWNNLGVLKAKTHGAAAAVASFKSAVSLNPGDPTATVNLTHTLWELKDPALTREFLENASRLAPQEPLPHLALADLLYERDDLAGAARHLEQASRYAESHPELHSFLEFVTTKVKRASQAEEKYQSRDSSHFTVKFDGAEDYATWTSVLDILEDAYREIGGRFGYYPIQPILVVLHTRARFHTASGSPAWADGLFDPILGRIQVPTQGALTDQTWLSRILRHEFVHALLHQRMNGRLRAVPTWLNEGLAMHLAGDRWADIEEIGLRQGEMQLLPLSALEGGWMNLPSPTARLAYLEGNSATQYLMDRFGMEKVREILGLLASGHAIGPALHDRLFMSYDEFQRRWLEDLTQRI